MFRFLKRAHTEASKYRGKLAVGLYLDGQRLQAVCLKQKGKKIKLVDAEILQPTRQAEPVPAEESAEPELGVPFPEESFDFEFNASDLGEGNLTAVDPIENSKEIKDLLITIFSKYPRKKYRVALSLPEPNIYYAYFHTDWQLKGNKLKHKVIEELGKERPNANNLSPDAIQLFNLADGRLMAVVRDNDISIFNVYDTIRSNFIRRRPRIYFSETAEISLVNLINAHYKFEENELSAVIHIGTDSSRLLFMQGNDILNISYIIATGLESENIASTIHSRLMLEHDNLQVDKLTRVILAGEAYESGIESLLREKLPEEVEIEYVKFDHFQVFGSDPLLARFAIAGGAALRALHAPKDVPLYEVDLTPTDIKDGQKKLKLGITGWLLLFLVPLITFFMTFKILDQKNEYVQLDTKLKTYKQELHHLQELEKQLNIEQNKLAEYNKSLGVLDSMMVDLNRWSGFLLRLGRLTKKINKMWITDLNPQKQGVVTIRGYSLYRNRIPRLTRALRHADLTRVEVQEIRGRKVYSFEIKYRMPQQ